MSASTERKNRQTARSEGSYAKDINAQKEAAKKKKQKIRWIIVGVALVVFFGFAIYLNSGALYRSLDGLTVKNTEVTAEDGTTTKTYTVTVNVAQLLRGRVQLYISYAVYQPDEHLRRLCLHAF